jgi:Mg-chelatase subunit ChlI
MGPGPAKPGSGANPEFLDDAVKQMRDARANKAQEWLSWVDNLDDVPPQMRNAIRQIMDAPGGMFADDVVARAAGNAGTFGGSVRMAEEVLQEQVGLALNHWRRTGTVPDPATVQRIAQQARKNVEGIYTNTGFRNIGAVADLFNPKRGGSLDDFLAWRNAQRQAGSMNQATDAAQKATGATQGGTAGSIRQFIQDHPWPAVAGGALGGAVLGGAVLGDDDTTVTVA